MIHNNSYTYQQHSQTEQHNPAWKQIPTLTEEQKEKFWARVDRKGDGECWPWTSTIALSHGKPYGRIRLGASQYQAHRIAYTLEVGEIPPGLTIDHVKANGCTTSLCCNPAHLEAVTLRVNVQRRNEGQTHCKWGHPKERYRPCKGCNAMNVKLYGIRHPEKQRAIKRNQKRKERARLKELVDA